jgi:hypothetical protein
MQKVPQLGQCETRLLSPRQMFAPPPPPRGGRDLFSEAFSSSCTVTLHLLLRRASAPPPPLPPPQLRPRRHAREASGAIPDRGDRPATKASGRRGEAAVNKGSGDNPAISFLAVLGSSPPANVVINEMTTVASVWTNAQFLYGATIKGPALSLRIAAGNVSATNPMTIIASPNSCGPINRSFPGSRLSRSEKTVGY